MAAVTCADGGSRESPAVEMKEPESVRKKTKHDPGKRMSDLNYLDDTDTKPSKKAEAFPANTWVFNPNANWRIYWDMTILIFVVYVLFVAPFELAFVSGDLSYQQRTSTIFSKKQRKNLGLGRGNRSLNDTLFLVEKGTVMQFGRHNPLVPFSISKVTEDGFLGDDIASLVAGHTPQPRWYTARTSPRRLSFVEFF
ncbi:hypothetical protein JL720_9675 [Aureococcus anophagefferens]|nr:hypothetical protein JL720_9675 [Aureococcus anophagefferens]